MSVKRFSISLDAELAGVVQRSAGESSEAVSAWLAEAARRRVRQDALMGAIQDFEDEHGVITEKERGQWVDPRKRSRAGHSAG